MKKFVLVDGYVSLNNEQVLVDLKTFNRDLKSRGGWLGVFFAFVGISVFHSIKTIDYFKTFFDYFDFGLRVLGGLTIIGVIYYLLFLKKSKKSLIINEIVKIKLDKNEFETDVSIVFSNKRELDVSFRNLEVKEK